jgi:uncharacterized protein with HEPN domain
MQPEVADSGFLWDMLESAENVVLMTRDLRYDQYSTDRKTRRAVEREVEIIGEAARKVSASFRDAHTDIPWRKIIGQRHKLAHEYAEIQDEVIWRVATIHIPELIERLRPLVPPTKPADPAG